MNPEPSSSPDLAAIDLSLSFAPAWAKEADSAQRLSRLAEKHGDGEDRSARGGKGRGNRDDRGPRRDRKSSRGDDRPRGGRFERKGEREPRPEPVPALTGWDVRFLPDRHGVDGLAKQIRASAKAYPLFDLARLVLEKSERYLVEFRRSAETPVPLFQLKADGTLWLSEGDALAHALKTQIDKFYRRERVAVDPPKGAFPFVAVCGMSGTLLGPPNYHDYQAKLRELHAARFANMPFEAFKSRIRMERDEELIAKWREEQSAKDVFYPVEPEKESAPAEPNSVAPSAAASSEPAAEATSEVPGEGSGEAPAEPVAGTIESTTDEPEAPAAEVSTAEESSDAPSPAESAPGAERLESLADVERHFRANHAAKAVTRIRDKVIAPGSAALNDSAAGVLSVTRALWAELDRFPLPLAHGLGQQLTGRGLQIFKHDGITFAGVARPKHLDADATPVSEGISGILAYLEAHAATSRAEQLKALVAARAVEPDPEAAVTKDLSWLLHEGHVIDYAKRGFVVAPRPKTPKPKPEPARPAVAAEKNETGEVVVDSVVAPESAPEAVAGEETGREPAPKTDEGVIEEATSAEESVVASGEPREDEPPA